MSAPVDELRAVFEAELAERELPFRFVDGRYELTIDGTEARIALDNLAREYDGDAAAVSRFLDSLIAGLTASLPDWPTVSASVFPLLESNAVEVGADTVTRPLSSETRLILSYFDRESGTVRFLDSADLQRFGIVEGDAWNAAEAELDRIMRATAVSYLDAGGLKLGVIEAHPPHKASLIRAPSLRAKVEPDLGWPVYAVAPSRGFVFLIAESDADQLERVGPSVIKEFETAGYPISTEVWEVSDAGIDAIGVFPTE